ncbi:MAG: SpoIIE family protein phosphatase, partial [Epsilonproteobacteria bacterium]|nr:SpoIIE family protein phosphatase [Campylobacterota bacterium]
VIVSGGVAGDNGQFVDSFAFSKDGVVKNGAACAAINSDELYVLNDYELNWQPIGKVMEVTKAEKNHLYTVDDMIIRDLYTKYLGEKVAVGLPLSASEFPLIKMVDGLEICRAFGHMFEDGSVLTIGNTYVGDKVRFSFGNVELIVNETKEQIYKKMTFQPEVIFNYSCAGRLAFLQSKVDIELEPFGEIAPNCGFFTYGELLHKNKKNYLLNYSSTFLCLAESYKEYVPKKEEKKKKQGLFDDKYLLVLEALTHLSNRVIEELNESKRQIEEMHKHTQEAVRYASLIQRALITDEVEMSKIFKDKFIFWLPKDIVGGDIWGFDFLRNEDEALLLVIDCTGHGIPGALVTMIVKSLEKEIVEKLKKHPEYDISPSIIMSFFNRQMKKLLNQYEKSSQSNAGFDGGIIYYNKKEKILKFTGAQTPLFYVEDGVVKTIKGDRQSVGYKDSDENYVFKEHILEVKDGMRFYMTTDGYLDQNGGEKGYPFGKKRFIKIIEQNYQKPMERQKEIFIEEFLKYKGDEEQNDDITIVGFEI